MIIGSKVIFRESLPSTNTYLSQLIGKEDLTEGTIIHTGYQSGGRGQSGNKWESEPGKNLLISILIYPSIIKPANQFYISMAFSLGVCDFLTRYIPGYSVKWPNDIYVNNDKIAGILIENSIMGSNIEYSIAGIGLNINQETFLSAAPNPVSLKILTGKNYEINTCLSQLSMDLDRRYKQVLSESFKLIRNDYVSKLYRLKIWSEYRDQTGLFTGRILSVSETGMLQIERKSGLLREYSFKEIEFIL
jgi:BirA family transcriptional regulator, biotin operon repressor / biotin---[acetyl-CoA-carboxylase] ligase